MSALPQISEAEFEVMKVVWKFARSTQMKLQNDY